MLMHQLFFYKGSQTVKALRHALGGALPTKKIGGIQTEIFRDAIPAFLVGGII
jgi:hypothetical protein